MIASICTEDAALAASVTTVTLLGTPVAVAAGLAAGSTSGTAAGAAAAGETANVELVVETPQHCERSKLAMLLPDRHLTYESKEPAGKIKLRCPPGFRLYVLRQTSIGWPFHLFLLGLNR